MVNGHVGLKYIYVRIFRKSGRMHKNDWVSVGSWIGIGVTCWVIAWIIGEGIPSFSNLVSLISSLFASWFSFGLPGAYWLHMNYGQWWSSPRKCALTIINMLIFAIGGAMVSFYSLFSSISAHANCVVRSWSVRVRQGDPRRLVSVQLLVRQQCIERVLG